MIKEAGFLWSAAMGNLLLCFLSSLLLCLLFLLVSLAEFLYLVSRISVGFQQAFRLSTKAWISVRKTPLITF